MSDTPDVLTAQDAARYVDKHSFFESPLLNIEQTCAYLQLSDSTLARLRKAGNGPKVTKLGARVMYRRIDLDAYIKSNISQ